MEEIVKEIVKEKLVIGPMAGFTDRSYREMMRAYGARFCVTEMISAAGLVYKNPETWEYARLGEHDAPTILQIFGPSAEVLAPAARALSEALHPAMIDINMGCPMTKIVREGAGSALLRDPERIREIVARVKVASSVPVSVKLRCGWDEEHVNIEETVKAACDGGADLVTIHGRTRSMFYEGRARRDWIARGVTAANGTPVIANGDITSLEEARAMMDDTGAQGVMVARATLGDPFLVARLSRGLKGLSLPPLPTREERMDALLRHYRLMVADLGEGKATLVFRSIGPSYLKGLPGARAFRAAFVKAGTEEDVLALVNKALRNEDLSV